MGSLKLVARCGRGSKNGKSLNPDYPNQDNGTKVLNYCIVIGPEQIIESFSKWRVVIRRAAFSASMLLSGKSSVRGDRRISSHRGFEEVSVLLNCSTEPLEDFVAIDDDSVCTGPIMANKDILELIQISKNIIDADSESSYFHIIRNEDHQKMLFPNAASKHGREIENIVRSHNYIGKHGRQAKSALYVSSLGRYMWFPHFRHGQRAMNMNRCTNAELADIHFIYGLDYGNGRIAVWLFGELYITRRQPNHQTFFLQVHQTLAEHESFRATIDDTPVNSEMHLVA
ncbi:hypothetical protein TNCV_1350221 [Trichonephila clavipes]|nr:hypothetical protein TNCV_1350221 [Trichonephila clavipes]